jgi:hypothetical protein
MARSNRRRDGLLGKIALVAVVGKALGGILRLAAMAGAAFLGWTVGRTVIDRLSGGDRREDLGRTQVATDVASP